MELIHGGDLESYRREYGREPLDFSANCNPLGVPAGVVQAIRDAAAQADGYPDPLCRELGEAIAGKMGLSPQQVLCGNGAADLIHRLVLARKPGIALVPAPSFAEYELALKTVGCRVIRHPLELAAGFALTGSILAALQPDVEILFLCNPHNPTGRTIAPDLLLQIVEACERKGILLVLDECFNGFLDEPAGHTLRRSLARCKHLLIIDAFTKLYGMAGVRLGYCLSADAALLGEMRRAGQPWAVSSLAQAAGIAALQEDEYIRRTRALIRAERAFLLAGLKALGVKVSGGEANFIFFQTESPDLAGRMRESGILIRDCRNYAGLSEGFYRIAVRRPDQNRRLIEALRRAIGGTE